MGTIETIKDIALAVRQLGGDELYSKILDVRTEVLEMQEQLFEKTKRIKELEEALALKSKLIFVEPAFYEIDKDGKQTDVPYCQQCWEGNGKLIHLVYQYTDKSQEGIYGFHRCPTCENCYKIFPNKPERKYIPPRGPEVCR